MNDPKHDTLYDRFRDEFGRYRKLWQEWRRVGESFPHLLLKALSEELTVPPPLNDVHFPEVSGPYLDLYEVSERDDWIFSDGPQKRTKGPWATVVTADGEWRFKLGLLLEVKPNAFPKTLLTIAVSFQIASPTLFEAKVHGSNKVHSVDTAKPQPLDEICAEIISLIEGFLMQDPYRDARTSKAIGFVKFDGS